MVLFVCFLSVFFFDLFVVLAIVGLFVDVCFQVCIVVVIVLGCFCFCFLSCLFVFFYKRKCSFHLNGDGDRVKL